MITVEILYADLSRQKAALDKLETLSSFNVLFILVCNDQVSGRPKNIAQSSGFDRYALCKREDEGRTYVEIFGSDNRAFVWKDVDNPVAGRLPVDVPLTCFHTMFDGKKVSAEVWRQAVDIFDNEMIP